MKSRALTVALGAIMALALSNVASAAVPSRITVGYNHNTERFHGLVRSSDAECQAGRIVRVFKKTAGGRVLQGKTMTNAQGNWKVEVMHAHGRYVAVTPKQKVMHTTCGKAKSRVVDVM
jgi:hypothetical protein